MADRALTGVLLVGGASTRFGSPKALARLEGETLAERAWRLLADACDETIAVGKRDFELPFEVVDDGTDVRAPLAGLVAGLRAATNDIAVVVPVDTPRLTVGVLHELADACRDVAHPPSGPLPGAYRKTSLSALESALGDGRYSLREAIAPLEVAIVALDETLLVNVNEPRDLERLIE